MSYVGRPDIESTANEDNDDDAYLVLSFDSRPLWKGYGDIGEDPHARSRAAKPYPGFDNCQTTYSTTTTQSSLKATTEGGENPAMSSCLNIENRRKEAGGFGPFGTVMILVTLGHRTTDGYRDDNMKVRKGVSRHSCGWWPSV